MEEDSNGGSDVHVPPSTEPDIFSNVFSTGNDGFLDYFLSGWEGDSGIGIPEGDKSFSNDTSLSTYVPITDVDIIENPLSSLSGLHLSDVDIRSSDGVESNFGGVGGVDLNIPFRLSEPSSITNDKSIVTPKEESSSINVVGVDSWLNGGVERGIKEGEDMINISDMNNQTKYIKPEPHMDASPLPFGVALSTTGNLSPMAHPSESSSMFSPTSTTTTTSSGINPLSSVLPHSSFTTSSSTPATNTFATSRTPPRGGGGGGGGGPPEMNRAQHLINEVHKLQIQQKNELAKMREVQMRLLLSPNAETIQQLATEQLTKAKKIEEQLKFLKEIKRQLLLEPPELHRLSFLLRDLQMQHTILELLHNELELLLRPHSLRKSVAQLYILNEPFPIVVTKKKQLVEEALQVVLLTGASVTIESYGSVRCTMLLDSHQVKESPDEMLSCDTQSIATTTHIAKFPLKFMCGTRTTAVSLRFSMQLKVKTMSGDSVLTNVESEASNSFVVITNKSQWQRSAGVVLKKDAFVGQLEISWPQFANTLQVHVLKATKQDLIRPTRALTTLDLSYLKSKFLGGRDFVTQKDFDLFWSWFGKNLSVLRYQRHIGAMWQNGYIYGFLTREQVDAALEGQKPGTFIMRFSERHAGQFGIAYVGLEEPIRIKHYLVQPNDTAGAKKTLPDFLGECPQFRFLLQCVATGIGGPSSTSEAPYTLRPLVKDTCLAKYYSRRNPPPSGSGYDPL